MRTTNYACDVIVISDSKDNKTLLTAMKKELAAQITPLFHHFDAQAVCLCVFLCPGWEERRLHLDKGAVNWVL